MEHQARTRLVTALVLVAVFGTGVLLGLAADSNVNALAAEVTPSEAADTAAEKEAPRRRNLYDEVEPNETQLTLIDSIIAEHRARTTALDEQLRGQYNAGFRVILLETREAIKGALRPDQAAEYQRLLDEYDARRAAEREKEGEQN